MPALQPQFAAHILKTANKQINTVELYMDYVCPFSAKMFKTIYESVKPLIEQKYPSKVEIVFRNVPQPWHPSSILTHEASLAVERLSPSAFFPFSAALYAVQKDFFDVNVVNESRLQTYDRLGDVAAKVGINKEDFLKLLFVPDKPQGEVYNVGNKITDDIKVLVREGRTRSIHVTPTVVVNGVRREEIGSSWTLEQWDEFLGKL